MTDWSKPPIDLVEIVGSIWGTALAVVLLLTIISELLKLERWVAPLFSIFIAPGCALLSKFALGRFPEADPVSLALTVALLAAGLGHNATPLVRWFFKKFEPP